MHDYSDELDYLDEFEALDERWRPQEKPKRKSNPRRDPEKLVRNDEHRVQDFEPTFHSSRHEREWILSYLGGFYEDRLISDVLRQVKGGKEAQVYCCAAGPGTGMELLAAKVYRPRIFRTMKDDSLYRLGQDFLDPEGNRGRRVNLAMRKKTGFGQEVLHSLWLSNEYETMRRLYRAGVDVPKPVAIGENALLMEYMGDEKWPAPALVQVRLPREEARPLFEKLMHDIELMLAAERVHADLSAHNILYWDGVAKIIDFPQAVDPNVNPEAYSLLLRDVERVCQYFARYGITSNPAVITDSLWTKYVL